MLKMRPFPAYIDLVAKNDSLSSCDPEGMFHYQQVMVLQMGVTVSSSNQQFLPD